MKLEIIPKVSMKNINPTETRAWKSLRKHFNVMKGVTIRELFSRDPNRFSSFSLTFANQMIVDFSKNKIDRETMRLLIQLAEECDLRSAISSMFRGEKINRTENRSVLHVALRNRNNSPIEVDGKNIMYDVNDTLKKMEQFCDQVIRGRWLGYSGKRIIDVVNIGIGGSDLGPRMVTESLKAYKNHLSIHFVSNLDGTHIVETLKKLDPETTIFLIVSKTFNTEETMTNARSAKDWFLKFAKEERYLCNHFIAISSNLKKAKAFGINVDNIFAFWDWVNGRYSLWSAVGLSIALSIGFKNFVDLLSGAHDMDQHFYISPLEKNLPVILALIGIWYNNFFRSETEAILPYDQYMYLFPEYLQQGSMESNGKCIDRNGIPVNYQTGPIVWGTSGTNGQHAFYQLIHQGTKMIPCDFIAPSISHNPISDHHERLLSNFFAQTEALAFGKKDEIWKQENNRNGNDKYFRSVPFRIFEGNRPSNSILLKKITPYNLGMLIALYEHKFFTQSVILNIYAFDQWGVELGKRLADQIFMKLTREDSQDTVDIPICSLIQQYQHWRRRS